MRKLTIKLNHLPESSLNPNKLRRLHWSERSHSTLEARQEVGWLAKSQWHDDTPMMKARISYKFLIKDRRKHDVENLLAACKPFSDGLIDAGVIFFDDMKHLEIGKVQAIYSDKDKTIILIEEIE